MGRLIDIDSLKGCAIIRPTSHESIEHIKQCGNDILNHNDIPTAYNVDAVVAEIQKAYCKKCRNILGVAGAEAYCKEQKCDIYAVYDIVRKGGVE